MNNITKLSLVLSLLLTSNTLTAQDIEGVWNLTSYGYGGSSGMSFSFVEGISYEFIEGGEGVIIKDGDTTNFTWEQKKKKMTIEYSGDTYKYSIVELSYMDLMIVDKNPGKDENRSYIAYEKGLIFKREF